MCERTYVYAHTNKLAVDRYKLQTCEVKCEKKSLFHSEIMNHHRDLAVPKPEAELDQIASIQFLKRDRELGETDLLVSTATVSTAACSTVCREVQFF